MQEIGVVSAVVAILNTISGWNLWAFVLSVLVLPPLCLAAALWRLARAITVLRDEVLQEGRESQDRYDNNVELVVQYEKMSKDQARLSDRLIDTIRLNTASNQRLADLIEHLLRKN